MQTESKSSESSVDLFEKICDEMVEEILGYLPLKDKFRLEGVSKQWQRVIYNQQTILRLQTVEPVLNYSLSNILEPISDTNAAIGLAHSRGFKQIKKLEFEIVLKKCKSISCAILRCFIDDDDLRLIGKYLEHLEELQICMFGITESGLTEFASIYGHRLKNLHFHSPYIDFKSATVIKKVLHHFSRIELLCVQNVDAYISDANEFLPKLESVPYLMIESEHIESIRSLTDKYSNRIKKLGLVLNGLREEEGKTILRYVEALENLQLFKLDMRACIHIKPIDQNLIGLSRKCVKIKYFYFNVRTENWVTNTILNSFESFCTVEYLDITFSLFDKKLECGSDCFRMCAKLKHLRVWCKDIDDEFFADIDQHLSKLRNVEINTMKDLTDKCLISLSKLGKLRKVWIRNDRIASKYITDKGVCQLISACNDIELIRFESRPKITIKTIDYLKAIALQRERKRIKFYCGLSKAKDELQFEQIEVDRLTNLPNNLIIIILTA